MPRQERTKSGTGIYHVMLRGINRQDIFEDAEDYLQMVACLRGLTERYDENGVAVEPLCTFYSYCLMSNHLHLLNDHRTVPWFSCPVPSGRQTSRRQSVMPIQRKAPASTSLNSGR